MAKSKFKNAAASVAVTEFGGIDRTRLIGDGRSALDIKNFRILPDGSLEKRCGYALALDLPGQIRAAWSGEYEGGPALVALAGDTVYLCSPDEASGSALGSVGTASGGACFFLLEGRLYLIDGGDIYYCTRASVTAVSGYVPLYGKNWTHTGGEVNEKLNQLSPHIRITYKLTTSSASSVPTGLAAQSVDNLIINGVPKTSGYSLNGANLNFGTTVSMGGVIEVCLNIGTSYAMRAALASCTGAAVYGGKYDTSVYCFGGVEKSRVFRSKYVSGVDVEASVAKIPGSSALYFPVGYDFIVAAGGAVVTSVCRHYDRLLLFTADDARMTDLSEDSYQDTPVRPVNSGVGCLGAGGVVLCDNDPVTISRDGVYRWTANTDERDESSAVNISLPVSDLIDRDFREGALAFSYREMNEIWFGNPSDAEGRVFVYNWRLGKWYCFTGIPGEIYFTCGGRAGFCSGGGVYLFSESEYRDAGAGDGIEAEYLSCYTDMGAPGFRKRMKRGLMVSSGGSEITLGLRDPAGELSVTEFNRGTLTSPLAGLGAGNIDCHEARAYTGRFDHVGYRISACGEDRQRIFGITLSAVK